MIRLTKNILYLLLLNHSVFKSGVYLSCNRRRTRNQSQKFVRIGVGRIGIHFRAFPSPSLMTSENCVKYRKRIRIRSFSNSTTRLQIHIEASDCASDNLIFTSIFCSYFFMTLIPILSSIPTQRKTRFYARCAKR